MKYKDKKSYIIVFTISLMVLAGFMIFKNYVEIDPFLKIVVYTFFYGIYGLFVIGVIILFIIDLVRYQKDETTQPSGSEAVKDITKSLAKKILIISIIPAIILIVFFGKKIYTERSNLVQDGPVIEDAKRAIYFLDSYYRANNKFPTSEEFSKAIKLSSQIHYELLFKDYYKDPKDKFDDQSFWLFYDLKGHHKEAIGKQCDVNLSSPYNFFGPANIRSQYCLNKDNYKQFLNK